MVNAFAGTGKTSTLVKYAEKHPELRMLYIAFNRSVREEADEKFPANVLCKTSHQLAWPSFGRNYANRLTNSLRLFDIANATQSDDWLYVKAIQDTLKNFMCSVDSQIMLHHCPSILMGEVKKSFTANDVVRQSGRLWHRMIDLSDNFPVIHDMYLKLYQLSQPNLSPRFDVILFDEAQDANPVTHDIVFRQTTKLVMVGDAHQQIYRFRGAVDALNAPLLTDADRLWLTHIVKRLNFDYIINMSYSLDFRRKVLAIKKEKGLSIRETAKRFCIGSATVSRWIKQIEPKPAASRSRKIDKSALEKDVRQYPDAYQRERAIRFGVCQKAIWQALKKLSITYKKKHSAILKQMKIYENRFVKK